jgi:hypothetical protein
MWWRNDQRVVDMSKVEEVKAEILRLIADGKIDQIEKYLERQLQKLSHEEKEELLAWIQPRE